MDAVLGGILGALFGFLFGLFLPGIHQNSLAIILVPLGPLGILLGLFSQFFGAVIPSIVLGASSGEISSLPGKRLFSEGLGERAILVSGYSLVISFGLFLLFLPAVLLFLPERINPIVSIALLSFFSALLILYEKRRFFAGVFFALAGVLGLLFISEESLFPAFSGFFGGAPIVAALLFSGKSAKKRGSGRSLKAPEIGSLIFPCFLGSIAGFFVGTFPALTVSVVASVFSGLFRENDSESFLALAVSGGISTFLFSLSSFSLLGLERSGSISTLLGAGFTREIGLGTVAASLLGVALSFLALVLLSKPLPELFSSGKLGLRTFEEISIVILFGLVGFLSGPSGLALFVLATAISVLAGKLGLGKRVFAAFVIVPALYGLVF